MAEDTVTRETHLSGGVDPDRMLALALAAYVTVIMAALATLYAGIFQPDWRIVMSLLCAVFPLTLLVPVALLQLASRPRPFGCPSIVALVCFLLLTTIVAFYTVIGIYAD